MLHTMPRLASMLCNSFTPGEAKSYRMWTDCSHHHPASCAAALTLGPVCDPADGVMPCHAPYAAWVIGIRAGPEQSPTREGFHGAYTRVSALVSSAEHLIKH